MARISIVIASLCFVGASAAQSAPRRGVDAGERAAGNPDKIICKTFTRIGTLAGRDRTCKTKKEWERERADHQDLGRTNSCRVVDSFAEPCKV
ncbi:MAG TPA: hypothetical protein VE053_15905 [Allosphingosinicella sp.]|nr:hypothetical protein [Allosphingosinicella sp.]